MKEAVLVIDMIDDFVYGKFGSEGARDIIDDLKSFLKKARDSGRPIFFLEDSHNPDDPEMSVWGEHAMEGGKGSETIDELKYLVDKKILKNYYDGFYETKLDEVLSNKSIKKVILTGVTTDICVQHTAAGAFFRGYNIAVLEDCTGAVTEDKHERALKYMNEIYGAKILTSKKLIKDRGN